MANKVVIDVEARFHDGVTSGSKAASKAVDSLSKKADNLRKKKVKMTFDADTSKILSKIKQTEAKARKLLETKPMVLKLTDKVSSLLTKIASKAKSVAGKTYNLVVKMRDSGVLSKLQQVYQYGKQIAGKTWRATVKVVDYATAPLRAIKNSLLSVKTLITAIVAGAAAKKLFGDPLAIADAYTGAKIGFSTLLGDAAGQQMMDDLDAFAKATPFNTTQVIQNAQKMLAMGWSTDSLLADMKTIGDAAAATGQGEEGLSRIVLALSQIQTKGRLSTEELNQLADANIEAKAMIAEGLGYGDDEAGLAAMTKDLENGAITASQGIQALLQGMKRYEGMMEQISREEVSGLWSQIQDTFEINILRKWGLGLQDGAKRGLGTVVDLLDESDDKLSRLGDSLYAVGEAMSNWGADKLENFINRITEISSSNAFQNAGLGDKMSMLWSGAIANPFSEWWRSSVVPWWESTAAPWISEKGVALGADLAKGMIQGFASAIGGLWDALPVWGKLLVGGMVAGKTVSAAGGVISGISSIAGLLGSTGTAVFSGSGLLGGLASAGYAFTGGAAGSALGGAAAAATGAGVIVGAITALTAVVSGIGDLVESRDKNQTKNESDAKKFSGITKLGGVAAGAAVGTAIAPGIGTLIGAGVGGVAGIIIGGKIENHAKEEAKKELDKTAKMIDGTTIEGDPTVLLNPILACQGPIAQPTAADFGVESQYSYSTKVWIDPKIAVKKKAGLTKAALGIQDSYTFSSVVNVTPTVLVNGSGYRGGIFGGASSLRGYSNGGLVRGGAQIIKVAEEGTPEMVIPLSSQRRDRGLKLWRKAGEMMGIRGFARGGTAGPDAGLRTAYAGAGLSNTGSVNLGGVTVHLTVHGGTTGRTADDIRAQKEEIAEAVAEVLVKSVTGVFSNTPRRGGI